MADAGEDMQNAIFTRLAASAELSKLFTPVMGARQKMPRLDFDGLETRPHPDSDGGIFSHVVRFSIWSDLYGVKDGANEAARLRAWFENANLVLQNSKLIAMRFSTTISEKDTNVRAWRHRVNFTAITEMN